MPVLSPAAVAMPVPGASACLGLPAPRMPHGTARQQPQPRQGPAGRAGARAQPGPQPQERTREQSTAVGPVGTRDFSPTSPSAAQQRGPAGPSSQLGIEQEAAPGLSSALIPSERPLLTSQVQPSKSRAPRCRQHPQPPGSPPFGPWPSARCWVMETSWLGSASTDTDRDGAAGEGGG